MHPSITVIPNERAVWIMARAPRTPPHLASLTLIPPTHPERGGTSLATMALSSATTGTGWAASVASWSASGPAEAGTGCSITRTPMLLSSAATSGASSGGKASFASTQICASENFATALTVSTSSHLHLEDREIREPPRLLDGGLRYPQSVGADRLGTGEPH